MDGCFEISGLTGQFSRPCQAGETTNLSVKQMNNQESSRILKVALIFYLPMLASGFFLKPPELLSVVDWPGLALGRAGALGAGLVVVSLSRVITRKTGWGKILRNEFASLLGELSSSDILLLSLFSAFGEEILFRGVIQPRLGLLITAGLFGLFHFPYRRGLLPWTIFALILGLALGLLTEHFQSLWPPIFLHFFINFFNLHDLVESEKEEEQ